MKHYHSCMQRSTPPPRPPSSGLGTLVGCFAFVFADVIAIKYFATTFTEALVLLGLVIVSAACGLVAATAYREGGDR